VATRRRDPIRSDRQGRGGVGPNLVAP
jgi:hypothetical protein